MMSKRSIHVQSAFAKVMVYGLTVFCILLYLPSAAQVSQPYRYERQQKNSDDYFNVISLKEKGIALFRERDKYKNNNRIWELVFLDTELKERKTLELEVRDRYKMVGYELGEDHLFFLFRTGETNRNDFELIDISYEGEEMKRYSIKPDLDFRLTHFIKSGDNFVFGGYVNNEAAVIIYSILSNNVKVVPGFFQKDTELVDLRANLNNTFNAVLIDRSTREDRKVIFRTFDGQGVQLLEDVTPIDEDRSLQTGITSALEREDLVLLGSWGERNGKQSVGFYALSVNPFEEQKIRYVHFGELNHYLDYLNPKRAERIKANTKDDVAAGQIPNFVNHVMPFRIVESENGFVLIAEVYDQVSTVNSYNSRPGYYNPYYSPYGYAPYWPGAGFYYPGWSRMYRPYMYGPNTRNSNEIKTLATVLIAFDPQGKVVWDYSVKLDDIKISGIEQVGDFVIVGNKAYLIYKKESDLKIKIVSLQDGDVSETTEKIKLLEEQDEVRSEKEFEGGVRQWYDDSFYVWGYQTIRNTSKADRTRDVFYITKIVAQ